jgi:RNA polymerase sigma-70 factor (ECF subfamily)
VNKKETFLAAIKSGEGSFYKIASVYTNNAEDRSDLVQEIIYQLWKSFDTYSHKSSLSTWMYRVALNVAIYHLKDANRRVPTVPIDDQLLNFKDVGKSGGEERWMLLKQHIDELNLLEKGIVILYLEEKSYEEIAAIIGISASNVGTKLSRIKEKLRNKLINNHNHGTRRHETHLERNKNSDDGTAKLKYGNIGKNKG